MLGGGNVPDVVKVALDCESFGADGITVHPVLTSVTFVVLMYMTCVLCCGLNLILKVIRLRNLLTWC